MDEQLPMCLEKIAERMKEIVDDAIWRLEKGLTSVNHPYGPTIKIMVSTLGMAEFPELTDVFRPYSLLPFYRSDTCMMVYVNKLRRPAITECDENGKIIIMEVNRYLDELERIRKEQTPEGRLKSLRDQIVEHATKVQQKRDAEIERMIRQLDESRAKQNRFFGETVRMLEMATRMNPDPEQLDEFARDVKKFKQCL